MTNFEQQVTLELKQLRNEVQALFDQGKVAMVYVESVSKRVDGIATNVTDLQIKNQAALRITPKVERELRGLASDRIEELGLDKIKVCSLWADFRKEFACGNSYKSLRASDATAGRTFIKSWIPTTEQETGAGQLPPINVNIVIEPQRWKEQTKRRQRN